MWIFFSSLLCIFYWNSADILRLVSFGVEEKGGRCDLMKFHEWAQFSIKFIAKIRCPKCVPFFIRFILSAQAYSYSHNILRLVNAKEYRAAWYKMLHGIKFVPKATIFFFETDFISQLAKYSNNSPVKDVQMLSDAIANGVHYYSTVTIWAAKIHATLFSMSVLHVSRTAYTHIAQMTAPIFFRLICLHFFHFDATRGRNISTWIY